MKNNKIDQYCIKHSLKESKILREISSNLKIMRLINKDYEAFHVGKIGWETSAFYCFKKKMLIFSYIIKL